MKAMACGISEAYEAFEADGSTQHVPQEPGASGWKRQSVISCVIFEAALLPHRLSRSGLRTMPLASWQDHGGHLYSVLHDSETRLLSRLLNISTLARERKSSAAALMAAWVTQVLALYLGQLAKAQQRWIFLLAALVALVPMAITMCAAMGGRLHDSSLMTAYRFLVTWVCICGVGFCWLFLFCQVFRFLEVHTEVVLGALLDYCLLGVSSLVISCAGPDVQAPLLPGQEEELSLYPGPHTHGFFPNLDFYDDNL
ncbi:unnamed protein product [Symbiodinium sp. CCMP2456]|nr:unnamed protein product [Symbiodinium sp. CCMP2456]